MLDNFWCEHKIFSLDEAKGYLALLIEDDLRRQIIQNDHATLVLTGGKSIVNFFSKLQKIKISWDKVTIMLSDDRLVAANDSTSNEKLIKERFLNKHQIRDRATYISIKEKFLENWQNQYHDVAQELNQAVIVLSMGQDGHVASLFSINDLSGEACLKYIPRSDFKRVTVSYNAIISACKIYIIVYGNKKIEFLNRVNINNFYLKKLFIISEFILIKDSI